MDTVCRSFASRLDRRRTLLITSVRFHRLAEEVRTKCSVVSEGQIQSTGRIKLQFCYLCLTYLCVFEFLCSVVFGQVGWPTWDVVQWNRGRGCPFCWSSHSESQRQMWKSRYPELLDICIYSHLSQWKFSFDFNMHILNWGEFSLE